MNFATKKETGVRQMTRMEIRTSLLNMKISVATMVTIPENSCVKPRSRPSESWSVSVMMRLTMSPVLWASRYFKGSTWICRIARLRMSCTTR